MPTGRNRKVGFGWGSYGKGKRWGKHDMSSRHIRSFSLTQENSRYLDTITRGHRSDAVNRALDRVRGEGFNELELLANIRALQTRLTELSVDSENPVALGWGKRLRLVIKRWFHI